MIRSALVTTVALAIAASMAGCGKSPNSVSSYSQLTHLSTVASPTPPVAQGYDPGTVSTGTTAITGTVTGTSAATTGALLLSLSSLVDDSGKVADVSISLNGGGMAAPVQQQLTSAQLAASNTLDFEHIPASALTVTLTAHDATGTTLGTQSTTINVGAGSQTKASLTLTASPSFGFTQAASGGTGTSTGTTGSTATGGDDEGVLGVEITSKEVERKFLLFKRLAVTVVVTNHNATQALNGEVVVQFHKTSGIFTKTDNVVQTLTQDVSGLAPGKTQEFTLESNTSADDAQATVHTVVATQSAN